MERLEEVTLWAWLTNSHNKLSLKMCSSLRFSESRNFNVKKPDASVQRWLAYLALSLAGCTNQHHPPPPEAPHRDAMRIKIPAAFIPDEQLSSYLATASERRSVRLDRFLPL